jgi:hypothetical protein
VRTVKTGRLKQIVSAAASRASQIRRVMRNLQMKISDVAQFSPGECETQNGEASDHKDAPSGFKCLDVRTKALSGTGQYNAQPKAN